MSDDGYKNEDELNRDLEDRLAGQDYRVGGIHIVLCMDSDGKQYMTVAVTGEVSKFQGLGMLTAAVNQLANRETF